MLVGEAYDRAVRAVHRQDKAALAVAAEELRRLDAAPQALQLVNAAAAGAVQQGNQFYTQATLFNGAARAAWMARAEVEYRYALRLAPQFDSPDPQMLNSLGYFLADQGKTKADFQQAERLTRRALQIWDQEIRQLTPSDPELPRKKFERAYSAHDSLAWALYKQGRYSEALQEQKQAVDVAAANAAAFGEGADAPLADLHFHLAEIYRALKRPADAITYYQVALRFNPDHEESRRALKALTGSDRPESSPTPEPTSVSL